MSTPPDDRVKLLFTLAPDDDGYPPMAGESVWATPTAVAGEYVIDNIPFFTRDATLGDVVATTLVDDVPVFARVVRTSGASLVRVLVFDPRAADDVAGELAALGCAMERAEPYSLIAASVPSTIAFAPVRAALDARVAAQQIDLEDAIVRHADVDARGGDAQHRWTVRAAIARTRAAAGLTVVIGDAELTDLRSTAALVPEDPEEDAHLRGLLQRARAYLYEQAWCCGIRDEYFADGTADVVAAFLFRIVPIDPDVDEWLWVITGDLPTAYFSAGPDRTAVEAITFYCKLMAQWNTAVRTGVGLDEAFPVDAEPTVEVADLLAARIAFVRDEILPNLALPRDPASANVDG